MPEFVLNWTQTSNHTTRTSDFAERYRSLPAALRDAAHIIESDKTKLNIHITHHWERDGESGTTVLFSWNNF